MSRTSNKKCLNCGAELESRYCPDCGQNASTTRFTIHSLAIHIGLSITRISNEFLSTAWGLLKHPWVIIKDYIYGKRVGLVSPVTMLLLLSLYWGIVMLILPHADKTENLASLHVGAMVEWIYGSITFQYIFLAVPISLATWVVYWKDICGRFNFAEILIAAMYLASTFLLVDFFLAIVEIFNERVANFLLVGIMAVYGLLSLHKAFPQKNNILTIAKLIIWSLITGVFLVIFLLIYAAPVFYSYISI